MKLKTIFYGGVKWEKSCAFQNLKRNKFDLSAETENVYFCFYHITFVIAVRSETGKCIFKAHFIAKFDLADQIYLKTILVNIDSNKRASFTEH